MKLAISGICHSHRSRADFDMRELRPRAGHSLSHLIAETDLDHNIVADLVEDLLKSYAMNDNSRAAYYYLALDKSLHARIVESTAKKAKAAKDWKSSADDKVGTLTSLARLVKRISFEDAKSIFDMAIAVSHEIDQDAIHEISAFHPFAQTAAAHLSIEKGQSIGNMFATFVQDAAIRLDSKEFPWETVAYTLAALDGPFALAVAGRWDDSGLIGRERFLKCVLDHGVESKSLSPAHLAVFCPLFDNLSDGALPDDSSQYKRNKSARPS